MGLSYKDLERTGKTIVDSVEDHLERRSQAKADAFVEKISQTRGLWVFLHIGALASIFVSVGTFIGVTFKLSTSSWIPIAVAAVVAVMWWRADFTKQHPFLSFVLGGFIAPVLLLNFASS